MDEDFVVLDSHFFGKLDTKLLIASRTVTIDLLQTAEFKRHDVEYSVEDLSAPLMLGLLPDEVFFSDSLDQVCAAKNLSKLIG